jgi:adenosylcobinamide-phosphate guanylyltransferase
MCGGKGTRIKSSVDYKIEKPLLKIKDKPMIEYLINTINETHKFKKIFAAVSNNTQKTRQFIEDNFQNEITLLVTSGREYSEDYLKIIKYLINTRNKQEIYPGKVLFIPADIPLVSADILIKIVNAGQEKPCLSIILEKEFIQNIGINPTTYEIKINDKKYCYTGISLIDISKIDINDYNSKGIQMIEEEYLILNYTEIACNINTSKDLETVKKIIEKF